MNLKRKTEKRADIIGKAISFINKSLAPVILSRRLTFKKQVKKLDKYIMPMNPIRPKRGRMAITANILKEESQTAVLNVKSCWSSPFKIPSETLSRYIRGTMGDRAQSRKPTSEFLYTRPPISLPAAKNSPEKIKPITEVILITFSVALLSA